MSKNPFANGLVAFIYIVLVASIMNFGARTAPHPNIILIPIAIISLFTLSAAVMGYIFCFQPIQLYFDGKKKQAVNLFLKTVAFFGVITLLMLSAAFSGLIK